MIKKYILLIFIHGMLIFSCLSCKMQSNVALKSNQKQPSDIVTTPVSAEMNRFIKTIHNDLLLLDKEHKHPWLIDYNKANLKLLHGRSSIFYMKNKISSTVKKIAAHPSQLFIYYRMPPDSVRHKSRSTGLDKHEVVVPFPSKGIELYAHVFIRGKENRQTVSYLKSLIRRKSKELQGKEKDIVVKTVVWKYYQTGFAIGLYHKGNSTFVIYLQNQGIKNLSGVIQSPSRFILELNGDYYAKKDSGGKTSWMPPGKIYGPLLINAKDFRKIPCLEKDENVNPNASCPEYKKGRNSFKVYYKLEGELIPSAEIVVED